jgi:taurine dioxygenase
MSKLSLVPSGQILGATVTGLNLSIPLSRETIDFVLRALGAYGVVRFPRQEITARQLRDFSACFGKLEVNVANAFQEPGLPEVMILSNIIENGRRLGMPDAGQDWHTDMSYSRTVALANVLYGIKIPARDGKSLGATKFANMHKAYEDLSADLKARLNGMTVLHDFNKFWEMMRREKSSSRPSLTQEQRDAKPPVSHPLFLTHPITGRKVLYANPGYAVRINELSEEESDAMLDFLFKHQLQEKYHYTFNWTEGDLLMLDNIGTLHFAVPDYGPDEPRLLKRCQVMATRFGYEHIEPTQNSRSGPGG